MTTTRNPLKRNGAHPPKRNRQQNPTPALADADLAKIIVEMSICRRLIDQCSSAEIAELNRWIPAMIDGIRRNQAATRKAFETFTGGTIQ